MGGPGAEGAEGVTCGEGCHSLLGRGLCPLHRKKLWISNGRILVQTVTVHLKLVLRSWERRSHCQNNFGNAVPRHSRWKRSLQLQILNLKPYRDNRQSIHQWLVANIVSAF